MTRGVAFSEQTRTGDRAGQMLQLSGLRVDTAAGEPIIEDISLVLNAGEVLGIVGESGSGKTTTALALLGATSVGARVSAGEIIVAGERIDATDELAARRRRGSVVSYVPQNPGTALNPSMRVGGAVGEMIHAHANGTLGSLDEAIAASLASVGLPSDEAFQKRYPHQLSGGQQQRVCIAVSLVCGPPLVVLDEPTTGLDVVTQATVLNELRRLRQETNAAMVYVTHDLGVVGQIADRIAVMYAGRIVEEGPTEDILRRPRHPYTRGLINSIPDHVEPRELDPMPGVAVGVGERPSGCAFSPRCPMRIDRCEAAMPALDPIEPAHLVRCIRAEEVPPLSPRASLASRTARLDTQPILGVSKLRIEYHGRGETLVAANDVDLALPPGGCLALVGESGSGKSSVAGAIAGIQPIAGGEITLDGEPLAGRARSRTKEQRRRLQIVFQNPADSLNPRTSIGTIIGHPARTLVGLSRKETNAEVARLLELVRLPKSIAERYPRELSGGEQQRVCIAEALAPKPDVLICDEITSSLDVSVQAAVLSLLKDLREELHLGVLFITHDLGVVASIAEDVVVLEKGFVRERGPVADVLRRPRHPYTRKLLESAPSINRVAAVSGEPERAELRTIESAPSPVPAAPSVDGAPVPTAPSTDGASVTVPPSTDGASVSAAPTGEDKRSWSRRHPIGSMALRRTAAGIVTLFVASILIFAAVNILPGNVAEVLLQQRATPEAVEEISEDLHLNDPLITRYLHWVGGIVTGDLGNSTVAEAQLAPNPGVGDIIGPELVNSLVLALLAMIILTPLSLGLGAFTAIRAGKPSDHALSTVALIFAAMPEFLIGTLLILVFFTLLDVLPPISQIPPGTGLLDNLKILILPVLTLLCVNTAYTARQIRATMIETMREDFVRMARLNGYKERRVIWRYAFRNALGPSVQVLGQTLQYLFGGIIVVESVFSYPGIGNQLVSAVTERDVQLVSVIAFILAAAYIAINIIVDLIVVTLVPKLRTEAK